MSRKVLILRPEPGATATEARARALALDPVKAPLFTIRSVEWDAPDPSRFDAVLLTSANGARSAGEKLARFTLLPCFAVGEATAEAALAAGFTDVVTGPADGAAALAMVGSRRVLHLCGRDNVPLTRPCPGMERRIVYAAEAAEDLPHLAAEALRDGALALLHSPRAATLLARLAPERSGVGIAAISAQAAAAAGPGWRQVHVAAAPRDEALLELAAKLCNIGAPATGSGG